MAKQSKQDRLKRIADGRCPIHGMGVGQVQWEDCDNSILDEEEKKYHSAGWCKTCGNYSEDYLYSVGKCGKKDCKLFFFFKDDYSIFLPKYFQKQLGLID